MAIHEHTTKDIKALAPNGPIDSRTEPPERNVDETEHGTFAHENKELPRAIEGWKVSITIAGPFSSPLFPVFSVIIYK